MPLVAGDDSEDAMMASLLGFLRRSLVAGSPAEPAVLVRLTDGRVRIVSGVDSTEEARHHVERLRNEFGVLERAFYSHTEPAAGGVLLCVDSFADGASKRVAQKCNELPTGRYDVDLPAWKSEPAVETSPLDAGSAADQCAWLRNSAILPGSLGNSMGPLAKVGVKALPSGAERLFVWYL